MINHVFGDHIALQLEFKNYSNTIVLQLCPLKCNSYVTTNVGRFSPIGENLTLVFSEN
jgi:hypothetical protein